MAITHYRELIVWQKAMNLVTQVYQLSKAFPKEEIYGLTNQIRRAAVSIPSNIAEGQARQSTAEFRNFLSIAQGSLAELETQLQIAVNLNYINTSQVDQVMSLAMEVSKMLTSLRAKLITPH